MATRQALQDTGLSPRRHRANQQCDNLCSLSNVCVCGQAHAYIVLVCVSTSVRWGVNDTPPQPRKQTQDPEISGLFFFFTQQRSCNSCEIHCFNPETEVDRLPSCTLTTANSPDALVL